MRRLLPQTRARATANLTPMIDVVFQLIIFFLLVAQFSAQQALTLALPRLSADGSVDAEVPHRAVINVVPEERAGELGGDFRLGALPFAGDEFGLSRLTERLVQMREQRPGLAVFVRADRAEPYRRVHPALEAAAAAGVTDVQLVIEPAGGAPQ